MTHGDVCVGSPIERGHLVSEPGRDSLGGARAVLRHRLDHKVHPIQHPLGRILVVCQEGLRLDIETERATVRRRGRSSLNVFDIYVGSVYSSIHN